MLVAPYAINELAIEIVDKLKKPYIDITMSVMEAFGVQVINKNYRHFRIPTGQQYKPCEYAIEPDASSASYFFAAAGFDRRPCSSEESDYGFNARRCSIR